MDPNEQLTAWQTLACISGPSLGKHGWWKGLFDCSHFILQGGKTGYRGFPSFDTVWYSKKRNLILHNFPPNWWREQAWQKYPTRINLPVSWVFAVAIIYSYLSLCDFMWVLIEKNQPWKIFLLTWSRISLSIRIVTFLAKHVVNWSSHPGFCLIWTKQKISTKIFPCVGIELQIIPQPLHLHFKDN